ncbi:Prolyl endopeptidase FAP [Lamellibrachia satsuma]|nr:Prolyl endopeptidase FAP [Lamellibrachia satsuma]
MPPLDFAWRLIVFSIVKSTVFLDAVVYDLGTLNPQFLSKLSALDVRGSGVLDNRRRAAWAQVLVPPHSHLEGNSNTKLPLLVHTYGGPGSQRVSERFSLGWHTYMASSHRVVYASLDGRGTASRGDLYLFQLYRQLGTLEVEDQLLGVRYFKKHLPYVDESKSAIWGWSYGGFLTLHALANESNEFPCGIAGAPLSDRRYYDTAHTERFMGFAGPADNHNGYERASVHNKIEHFRNRTLLLVHGTADDNVHFASSAHLISALTEAEIQFRLQVYPDLNHYFRGRNRHLARLMTDFLFNDCWARKWLDACTAAGGSLRLGTKSALLTCLEDLSDATTSIVLDGAVIVQMLKPAAVKIFDEYDQEFFIPYLSTKLHTASRVDLGQLHCRFKAVQDQSLENECADMTCGHIAAATPGNWQTFL